MTASAPPLYELRGIRRVYGRRTVLDVDHLDLAAGRVVGFVGPNGSGKSTLLRLLAFLDVPDDGSLRYGGRLLWDKGMSSDRERNEARNEVTLLLQEPYLLKRSVFENVAYGLKIRGDLSSSEMKDRVFQALRSVGLDGARFASRLWYQLSGGEAQRVALASRLALRPRVLLLDEPTSSVDVQSALRIQEAALLARDEWGTTLLLVSHDQLWLNDVADDVVHFFGGRIIAIGPENLVLGPWRKELDGLVVKDLADGQRLRVLSPPSPGSLDEAVAAVDPGSILLALSIPEGLSARNALRCSVTQMVYENGTGRVLVKVQAGGLVLTARLTGEAVRDMGLHPGRDVSVLVKASAFRWI